MDESTVTGPLYTSYSTKTGAMNKIAAINAARAEEWGGLADNYANPIQDVDGKWWLIMLPEYLSHFTNDEISAGIPFEDIDLGNSLLNVL
ncbi:MAG: hypothetical protein L6Q78_10930 [Bacteroidia bacterium]|nr:hypothetical protein [Bacteroidia bacterium]